jgi:hypothetical protein
MERGKGIPKAREEDKRREVCEWEGCVFSLFFMMNQGEEAMVTRTIRLY